MEYYVNLAERLNVAIVAVRRFDVSRRFVSS